MRKAFAPFTQEDPVTADSDYALATWETDRLLDLFSSLLPKHMFVEAVLRGIAPGRVYANAHASPTAAALYADCCWYVVGEDDEIFWRGIREQFPSDTYSVIVPDETSDRRALEILTHGGYYVDAISRYAERTSPIAATPQRPEGYTVAPVDRALMDSGAAGVDDVLEEIAESWNDLDAFYDVGFGTCSLCDGDIVCRSITTHAIGQRCEIGIWTHPAHRRRGLGGYVASVTADEAFRRGMKVIGWHSWANNAGSIGVSRRAGLVNPEFHTVYINHWPAANPSDMEPAEFRAFALRYERMFEQSPPLATGYPHIVAATAWALAGNHDGCLRHLHRAVDIGWLRTTAQLRTLWPELFDDSGIESREAWRDLFERLDPTP